MRVTGLSEKKRLRCPSGLNWHLRFAKKTGKTHETICHRRLSRGFVYRSRCICTGPGEERTGTQTNRVSYGITQTRSEICRVGNAERFKVAARGECHVAA